MSKTIVATLSAAWLVVGIYSGDSWYITNSAVFAAALLVMSDKS